MVHVQEAYFRYLVFAVCLVLGNFYKACGRAEMAACHKTQVKECLRKLNDDDTDNSQLASVWNVGILAAIGDDEGVISMCYHMAYTADDTLDVNDSEHDGSQATINDWNPGKAQVTCS